MQVFFSEYYEILRKLFLKNTSGGCFETGRKSLAADDLKLIRNNNLRCEQQQRTTTNCCYKGIRQHK